MKNSIKGKLLMFFRLSLFITFFGILTINAKGNESIGNCSGESYEQYRKYYVAKHCNDIDAIDQSQIAALGIKYNPSPLEKISDVSDVNINQFWETKLYMCYLANVPYMSSGSSADDAYSTSEEKENIEMLQLKAELNREIKKTLLDDTDFINDLGALKNQIGEQK